MTLQCRHGQEVLEVFVNEMADLLRHDHVDRHHREQLLQDEKECTLKTVTGIATLICISVISIIRVISVISVINSLSVIICIIMS
jgi:hypothetical protein